MKYWHEIESPVGPLLLAGTAQALTGVHFHAGPCSQRPPKEWRHEAAPFMRELRTRESFGARAFGLG